VRKLIVMISLLLLVNLPVSANPVNISGIGDVELGQNITVTEGHDSKGKTTYGFKVKDGDLWRGACLFAPQTLPDNNNISNIFKLDALLNKIVDEKFSKNTDFVAADKAKLLKLGNKEAASVTFKMTNPAIGIVLNMNMILVSTTDGVKMVLVMYADSDTPYWRPIFNKIISNIP